MCEAQSEKLGFSQHWIRLFTYEKKNLLKLLIDWEVEAEQGDESHGFSLRDIRSLTGLVTNIQDGQDINQKEDERLMKIVEENKELSLFSHKAKELKLKEYKVLLKVVEKVRLEIEKKGIELGEEFVLSDMVFLLELHLYYPERVVFDPHYKNLSFYTRQMRLLFEDCEGIFEKDTNDVFNVFEKVTLEYDELF